eukprot:89893_1
MSISASQSNKQAVVRLVNRCNERYESNINNRNYNTKKVKISNDICKIIADIGLNHSDKIISIASQYAYNRLLQTVQLNYNEIRKQKNKNRHKLIKKEIIMKIESCDILNAISYLGLPLSPKVILKHSNQNDSKQLNSLFLQ